MKTAADFILRDGEGSYPKPEIRRECWIVGKTNRHNTDILIVKTEPQIFPNGLAGLARRERTEVQDFGRVELAGAVVWQVELLADGQYEACKSLGLTLVFSEQGEANYKRRFPPQEQTT